MRRHRKPRPLWLRVLLGEAERQIMKQRAAASAEMRRSFDRAFASSSTEHRRRWARASVRVDVQGIETPAPAEAAA